MKNKIKYYLSIIILISSCLSSYAQQPSASNTLESIDAYYKSLKVFDFEMEYKMYKGYTGNHITESYKGTLYKNEDVSQVKILGSEIIQFTDKHLTINKDSKTLIYSDAAENMPQKSPMDVSAYLKFYKETVTTINGNTLIHEMVLKNNQVPMPYNKIVIYVNKNTYEIQKQILYFTTKMPFIDKNGKETPDAGRMEINFRQNKIPVKKAPKLNDYVILDVDKKVRLAGAYANYTIVNKTNL